MNRLEDIFFTLLRSALWDKVPELKYPPTEQEWNDIYAISKEQTVTGIMLDAISKLHETQRPPKRLLLQWIAAQKFIEKKNISMNKELVSIVNRLKQQEITTYLLKGQGIGKLYPHPTHRICGDIDLLFNENDFEKAVSIFTEWGCNITDEPDASHAETEYHGILLELHRRSATFFTKRLQRRYNEIIVSIVKSQKEYVTIDGENIEVLPPMANALQLMSHMLRHILMSGLGLRQVCDWVLFLHRNSESIDSKLFVTYMKELQLFKMYKAILVIATDYLGLPGNSNLCDITREDKHNAKKLMSHIMINGNFGHYREDCTTETKWEYLKVYLKNVKHSIKFRCLSKAEAFNYPIWQLRSISKVLKK